uniref:Uncharacterized protein n=1 Tax=Rhipicephalus zambeziensis TaxID=60191 RepID=A0A224YEH2_9ACAR
MGSSSPSSSSLPFFALSASGWVLRRLDSGSDCWAPRLAPLRRLGVGTFSSSSSSSSSSAAVAAAARLPRVLRELRFGRSSAAGVLRSSAAGFRPLRRGVTTSSSSSSSSSFLAARRPLRPGVAAAWPRAGRPAPRPPRLAARCLRVPSPELDSFSLSSSARYSSSSSSPSAPSLSS